MLTPSDTAVGHRAIGRRDQPFLCLPLHYLGLTQDRPPPHCPWGQDAAWSGTPLKRSLARGAAGVIGVSPADPAHGQHCWGRGPTQQGLHGEKPQGSSCSHGTNPISKGLSELPRDSPFPHPPGTTLGCSGAGREELCPGLGWAEMVGRKLLS